ncbi:MAG: hypothetical protein QXR69_02140 [Conexivisphaerales archaeon]
MSRAILISLIRSRQFLISVIIISLVASVFVSLDVLTNQTGSLINNSANSFYSPTQKIYFKLYTHNNLCIASLNSTDARTITGEQLSDDEYVAGSYSDYNSNLFSLDSYNFSRLATENLPGLLNYCLVITNSNITSGLIGKGSISVSGFNPSELVSSIHTFFAGLSFQWFMLGLISVSFCSLIYALAIFYFNEKSLDYIKEQGASDSSILSSFLLLSLSSATIFILLGSAFSVALQNSSIGIINDAIGKALLYSSTTPASLISITIYSVSSFVSQALLYSLLTMRRR